MKFAAFLYSARTWIARALVRLAVAIQPGIAGSGEIAPLATTAPHDAAMITAIDRAIAAGSNTVEINGTQVRFSCTREMRAERDRLAKLQSIQAAG